MTMDDWQKEFWQMLDDFSLGVENFFQDVSQAIEEFHTEIATDLEVFLQDLLPSEFEEFLEEIDFFPDISELDTDFLLNPKVEPNLSTHAACIGCHHYHGRIYGDNLLVCGMHPYGWDGDTCPDWEKDEEK